MKRKISLLACFMMVFALINIGTVLADDLPYNFTVSETLGHEKATVTLYNYDTGEPEDQEIEFVLVPNGATLSFTPDIDFSAVMMFYSEDEGVYWDGPSYWEVDGSMYGYNYVEANKTAVATFSDMPNSFYELSIFEEGYERSVFFKVQGGEAAPVEESNENVQEAVTEVTATPSSSNLLVNGEAVEFTAYNIAGNNYFKLRDLAMVVTETEKQFEVVWDGDKNAINLISGSAYTPVGGELEVIDQPNAEIGKLTTSTIYKDDQEIELTAYNIGGNNYFKLRDIAQAFNIGVAWDGPTQTISIDTSEDYIPE